MNGDIEMFNPNMLKEWAVSENKLRKTFGIPSESIFPLEYQTKYKNSKGETINGWYGR